MLSGTFKALAITFFVGFGLASCSHSSGDDSSEVVEAPAEGAVTDASAPSSDANAEPTSVEAAEVADVTKTEPVEAPPVLDDAPPAELAAAEQPVAAIEEAPVAPAPEVVADHPQEPTLPDEDATTGTVQAELTDKVPATPPAVPEVPVASDSLADAFEAKSVAPAPEAGAAIVDGNSISSPGAARFIKSRHDHPRSRKMASSHTRHKRGGKSAPAGKAAAAGGSYVVLSGDTLGTIAKKIYGSNKEWKVLADFNGLAAPYIIRVGDIVKFDDSSDKAKAFVAQYKATMKTVVVKKGDSLSKIAAAVYGDSSRWKQLLVINKDKISNPNQIAVGMSLSYVEGGAAAAAPKAAVAKAPRKAKAKGKAQAKRAAPAAGTKQSE